MTDKVLRVKISEDEFKEIDRVSKKYKISYNKIIRSGVQLYLQFIITKEEFSKTAFFKTIKLLNKDLQKQVNSPKYQAKLEKKIREEIGEKGIRQLEENVKIYEKRTKSLTKKRKVGRPKKKKSNKPGRPKNT